MKIRRSCEAIFRSKSYTPKFSPGSTATLKLGVLKEISSEKRISPHHTSIDDVSHFFSKSVQRLSQGIRRQ